MCQSVATPSQLVALYWHMGGTQSRFLAVTERSVIGSKAIRGNRDPHIRA